MKSLLPPALILLLWSTHLPVVTGASILYNTTDLGSSYTLQSAADGRIMAVTGANGSGTYLFDKSPVVATTTHTTYPESPSTQYDGLSLQSGAYQVGVIPINGGQFGIFLQPTFEGAVLNNWQGPGGSTSPIADINPAGQVVGQSTGGLVGVFQGQIVYNPTYAAFTADGMQSHGLNSALVDNLNNVIAPLPDTFLTAAVRIDDQGRIIAQAYDGDDYLLSPIGLGDARPIPEPTTVLTWSVVGAGLVLVRRWWLQV